LPLVKPQRHDEWLAQIGEWMQDDRNHDFLRWEDNGQLSGAHVVHDIWEATGGQAMVVTDVGQHQMLASQYYPNQRPEAVITSGGLGTMGFGLPAAIGAQIAFPHKTVIDVAGDGSIQMNIQEMAVAVHEKLPVKVAILNNCYLGMVRQWQDLFYDKRYACTCLEGGPDFVKLAEAYGAVGLRATKPEEVAGVITQALETPGPVIMEFKVEKEECVYPMVPAGAPITEMLLV
jgi:acetolactate synthase-1/2/3 large subunit